MKMKEKALGFVQEIYGYLERHGWPNLESIIEGDAVKSGLRAQIEKHFKNLKHPKEALAKLEIYFQNNRDTEELLMEFKNLKAE